MWQILTGNPFFASCLLASLLLLVWKLRVDRQLSPAAIAFPIFWSVGSTFVLGMGAALTPVTLDRYLFAADGSFGFQPAFAGARYLLSTLWLWNSAATCYFNLPLAMSRPLSLPTARTRRRGGIRLRPPRHLSGSCGLRHLLRFSSQGPVPAPLSPAISRIASPRCPWSRSQSG